MLPKGLWGLPCQDLSILQIPLSPNYTAENLATIAKVLPVFECLLLAGVLPMSGYLSFELLERPSLEYLKCLRCLTFLA